MSAPLSFTGMLIKSLRSVFSGGQKRRVSFAVALLSDPEILILDEPTVGVDPLLRQRYVIIFGSFNYQKGLNAIFYFSIWNHLCSLVQTGKTTVIITTHYIEEAKQADTVSLLGHSSNRV